MCVLQIETFFAYNPWTEHCQYLSRSRLLSVDFCLVPLFLAHSSIFILVILSSLCLRCNKWKHFGSLGVNKILNALSEMFACL